MSLLENSVHKPTRVYDFLVVSVVEKLNNLSD